MKASYEADVVVWANEQAELIRAGRFDLLDLEHIAEEIEDVGKSEQRELASRMAVLMSHLLKWQYQPDRRGASWRATIRTQRNLISKRRDCSARCRQRDLPLESKAKSVEEIVPLLAEGIEVRADDGEVVGPFECAKASRDFLLYFRHSDSAFA